MSQNINLILVLDAAVCVMILITCLAHLILLLHAVKQDPMMYRRGKARVILGFMAHTLICGAMTMKIIWYVSMIVGSTWIVLDEYIIQLSVLSTFWLLICSGLADMMEDVSSQNKLLKQLKTITNQADTDYENYRETG